METLLALLIFLSVFVTHIILHRVLLKMHVIRFEIMILYPLGAVILFWLLYQKVHLIKIGSDILPSAPITSSILYVLLSCYVVLMYVTPYLDNKMPTSVILTAVFQKKKLSYAQISQLFTNKELIRKRILDLVKMGYMTSSKEGYKTTRKGKLVIALVRGYEKLFHWQIGG